MKIKQIKQLYNEFGLEIALSAVCSSSFKMAAPWKHHCILSYLREKYGDFISGYAREARARRSIMKNLIAGGMNPAKGHSCRWSTRLTRAQCGFGGNGELGMKTLSSEGSYIRSSPLTCGGYIA